MGLLAIDFVDELAELLDRWRVYSRGVVLEADRATDDRLQKDLRYLIQ